MRNHLGLFSFFLNYLLQKLSCKFLIGQQGLLFPMITIFSDQLISLLQVFHDLCLCGFLGDCASFIRKLEKDMYDFPSWKNEAGRHRSLFLYQRSFVHETGNWYPWWMDSSSDAFFDLIYLPRGWLWFIRRHEYSGSNDNSFPFCIVSTRESISWVCKYAVWDSALYRCCCSWSGHSKCGLDLTGKYAYSFKSYVFSWIRKRPLSHSWQVFFLYCF